MPSNAPSSEGLQELERGAASWYGLQFHGRRTANGERFDMRALTAAHKTLPFGTRVRVRSLVNGREVDVRINDRGPYVGGRIIDLSHAAAEALDMLGTGIKQVVLSSASPVVQALPPRSRAAPRARAKATPNPRANALPADPALR
jgi:rare lipoprotein A